MPKINRQPIAKQKSNFIEAYTRNLGIVTLALKECRITYNTYKKWLNTDPKFYDECKEVENIQCDFVENKLMELISEKNVTAVIFYLKNRRPEKWNEKQQLDVNVHTTSFQIGSSNDIQMIDMKETKLLEE